MSGYDSDLIDGRLVPPLVITSDTVLAGTRMGTIHVEGALLTLRGTNRGTIVVHEGAGLMLEGTQAGTVYVARGGQVTILGALNGETTLEPGATVVVEATGRLAGGLTNAGRVIVRGVYGGCRRGPGAFVLEGVGRLKSPEVIDGITTYIWREND
jgi:hypothetical protein